MLYSVNVQGKFRYRTHREGQTRLHVIAIEVMVSRAGIEPATSRLKVSRSTD
jgi:hypothetical protein